MYAFSPPLLLKVTAHGAQATRLCIKKAQREMDPSPTKLQNDSPVLYSLMNSNNFIEFLFLHHLLLLILRLGYKAL